jgi:hypothetical protein
MHNNSVELFQLSIMSLFRFISLARYLPCILEANTIPLMQFELPNAWLAFLVNKSRLQAGQYCYISNKVGTGWRQQILRSQARTADISRPIHL